MRSELKLIGKIVKIFPIKSYITRKKQIYVFRRIIISEYRGDEVINSAIVAIPENFDIEKINKLIGVDVVAFLQMKIETAKNGAYYNTLYCYRIEPIPYRYKYLRQDRFDHFMPKKGKVDKDGYLINSGT